MKKSNTVKRKVPIRKPSTKARKHLEPHEVQDGFRKMLKRAAAAAGLAHLNVNPHGLRHGTGHYLAERGTDTRTIQDYLGHRDIRQTAQYTEASSARFQGLWDK
jgi:site-specific recombinase XerD